MDRSLNSTNEIGSTASADAGERMSFTFAAVTLGACYLLLWFLRWPYKGLEDDGMLYALQAYARIVPGLGNDIFLKYGSQDAYTIFSPLFAGLIHRVGLMPAGALLMLLFQLWSAVAAWFIARQLSSARIAWLCLGVVLMMPGEYGSLNVFQYSETFLTARLPAESFVLTSLALVLSGRTLLGAGALLIALLIHPLMAAPGIAVFVLFRFPQLLRPRILAAAGILIALGIALCSWIGIRGFAAIEDEWLRVIRERSYYIFADRWRPVDWDLNLLGLISLLACYFVAVDNAPLRRLAPATATAAATGLLLTCFTSFSVPVEIIVQGQPWRWLWISNYIAVLVLPLVVVTRWHALHSIQRAGLVVLAAAWVVPAAWAFPIPIAAALACASCVCVRWGSGLDEQWHKYVWGTALCIAALLVGTVVASTVSLMGLEFTTNKEPWAMERARDILGLSVPGIAIAVAAWYATMNTRLWAATALVAGTTLVLFALAAPYIVNNWRAARYTAGHASFAEWRAEIDHRRSVFWPQDPVAAWFLLESPSYLSIAQTAGVVFSRDTAMEAVRRAAVLRPINTHSEFAIGGESFRFVGSLSAKALAEVCKDPELGYVVSKLDLDIPHLDAPRGPWSTWKLYSCDKLGTAQ